MLKRFRIVEIFFYHISHCLKKRSIYGPILYLVKN